MSSTTRLLLCLGAGVVLCQCSGPEKKSKKPNAADMPLAQRAMLKPNENQRSSYEKYLTDPKSSKGQAGAYYQKQMHHSKSFNGADSYAGQKEFKTGQSWFSKSRERSADMTYSLGDKQAGAMSDRFKTNSSRFGSQQARESDSTFGANTFKTGSALSRSKINGKWPDIIENYNDKGGGKKSAYSEDEVKRLLNRN
ncbi:MAG TPA: hypothetical protein PLB55_23195 [Prosthecobacter sp.]|jgi:hypothetical protein|nr:hypothetical protein [Prosthecobacter sp.]